MLALDKWAEGRFKPMAMLAQLAAANAEPCYDVIQKARRHQFITVTEARGISPGDWVALYRHPSWVEGVACHAVLSPEAVDQLGEAREQTHGLRLAFNSMLGEVLEQAVTVGISEREIRVSQRLIDRCYHREHLPMLEQMLHDKEPMPEGVEQWRGCQELIFFMSIVAPCWLEFHVSPWNLYRWASRGHFQSLQQLLRLDPDADKDPQLSEQVFRLRQQRPARYKLLQKARYEGCRAKIELDDVKFMLGGLLMKWSREWDAILRGELHFEILQRLAPPEKQAYLAKEIKRARERNARTPTGCLLKTPDIKSLFDAVAQDTGKGAIDPAFLNQPHSNYKRLSRNMGLLPGLRKQDKSRAA